MEARQLVRSTQQQRALPELAFFRGRVVPYASVRLGLLTHALNYGTAGFGGLRAFWNEEEQELFVFRPLDFRRFLDSARLLRMDLPHSPGHSKQTQRCIFMVTVKIHPLKTSLPRSGCLRGEVS